MQYKLHFSGSQKERFVKAAKKAMYDQDITYAELARLTGFTVGSIQVFFSDKRPQGFMAAAISDVLGIRRSLWQ